MTTLKPVKHTLCGTAVIFKTINGGIVVWCPHCCKPVGREEIKPQGAIAGLSE